MLRTGLTGGLASGKSTVAAFFRELGAFHVDADRIVHELLAPGGAAETEVVARFGRGIVGAGGVIDRKALGTIVFADPRARAELNAIVHPKVRAEIARRLAAHASGPAVAPVAIVDAALLVESGIPLDLDALVVVACDEATQLARAVGRGLTEEDARARIAAQAPIEAKIATADFVIDNDGSLDETRRRVGAVGGAAPARAAERLGRLFGFELGGVELRFADLLVEQLVRTVDVRGVDHELQARRQIERGDVFPDVVRGHRGFDPLGLEHCASDLGLAAIGERANDRRILHTAPTLMPAPSWLLTTLIRLAASTSTIFGTCRSTSRSSTVAYAATIT